MAVEQELANSFDKAQTVKISGFACRTILTAIAQLCCYSADTVFYKLLLFYHEFCGSNIEF